MGKKLVRGEMMRIERLTAQHIDQIAALEKRCFSDPWSREMLIPELTNPLSLWLVALDQEQVIGYVGSQSVLDAADMMNIAVSPDFRRQGVGQQLVLELITHLKLNNVTCLTLEVRVSNQSAQRLYERLGFETQGIRKKYYEDKEDALIMWCELNKEREDK